MTIERITYKDEWLDNVIQKGKFILEALAKETFNRYREMGKLIIDSGYQKGQWHSEHREKACSEWGIVQKTFSSMIQLGEMSEIEFSNVVTKFSSLHAWANRGILERIQAREELIQQLRDGIINLDCPKGKYDIIVVDPAWPVEHNYNPEHWRGTSPFPEMSIEEIKAIDLPTNNNCVVWLWTTNRFLHDAFHVIEAWDLEVKNVLTWIKHAFSLGVWLRGQTEHCILAIKGQPIIDLHEQATVIFAKRREHSRKPDEFYTLVDSLCFGKKLDYFSRESRDGWDSFGTNELSENAN